MTHQKTKQYFGFLKAIYTNPQKCKKWGQIFLVSAIILNAFAISLNLQLSSLQGELQNKRYDEQYFIMNEQTKKDESDKWQLIMANLCQLEMLKKLADEHLTPQDRITVEKNIKIMKNQSEVSKISVAALTYLLANDPPDGADPFTMFEHASDSELIILISQYEKQAYEFSKNQLSKKIRLMDNISFWQYVHSSVLMFGTIILIIGSILTFRSEFIDKSGS